jgi:SAM-dependent methyltransferase
MTDFQRYLHAKRTVDDRALNRRVIEPLHDLLATRATDTAGPLRILEIGAGIGTMLARLLEWELLPPGRIHYTAVDIQAANIETLPSFLDEWAGREPSFAVTNADPARGSRLLKGGGREVLVDTVAGEGVSYAADAAEYDLVLGAALLDIIDRDCLPTLLSALATGGIYYFPLIFDGATRFRPQHPADETIEVQYHTHMDRKEGGNSRAGGEVVATLQRRAGTRLLRAGGSDWFVRPVDGAYPADEAYFLGHILDTVEEAVSEMASPDASALAEWVSQRRGQLDAAELLYTTHQLDVLGVVTE